MLYTQDGVGHELQQQLARSDFDILRFFQKGINGLLLTAITSLSFRDCLSDGSIEGDVLKKRTASKWNIQRADVYNNNSHAISKGHLAILSFTWPARGIYCECFCIINTCIVCTDRPTTSYSPITDFGSNISLSHLRQQQTIVTNGETETKKEITKQVVVG
jgi:hypothetical protein